MYVYFSYIEKCKIQSSGTVQNQRNHHFSISIVYLIIYFLQIEFYNIHKKFWLLNNKYPLNQMYKLLTNFFFTCTNIFISIITYEKIHYQIL